MHDSFAALLRQPTARRYKQLRSQLLANAASGDFSISLDEVQQLIGQGDDSAEQAIADLLRVGLLSLRLHRLAGQCAIERGDQTRAELHRFTYDSLVDAIMATGNG